MLSIKKKKKGEAWIYNEAFGNPRPLLEDISHPVDQVLESLRLTSRLCLTVKAGLFSLSLRGGGMMGSGHKELSETGFIGKHGR